MTTITCDCGSTFNKKHLTRHLLTKKHLVNNNDRSCDLIHLNEDQLKFVQSDIQSCNLLGNPGCGKTRSIIDYCINKFNRGQISNKDDFLIITFSKSAQTDFLKKGKASSRPNIFSNQNIRTIHSLAAYIYKKLNNASSTSLNTLILATYRAIQASDHIDLSILKNYKFIVIDEAQDINFNQYQFATSIANKLNIPCILVGDPNQNIYQFQGGSDKYLIEHSDKSYNLSHNYRSTNEIISFLNCIRPYDTNPKMISGNNISGPKPIIYVNDISNIKNYIIDMIKSSGYKYEDIAIIGPVKQSRRAFKTISLSLICQFLFEAEINFITFYSDSDKNSGSYMSANNTRREGHVNILTCHGSKGLEFKMTIVVNYHFRTFKRQPTESDYYQHKYLWYVALSRAIEKLVICASIDHQLFPTLAQIPSDLYQLQSSRKCIIIPEDKVEFRQDAKQTLFFVTDILCDYSYFDEDAYFEYENMNMINTTNESMIEYHDLDIPKLNDKYSILYGMFVENLFMFYYYKSKISIIDYVKVMIDRGGNMIAIDGNKYYKAFTSLRNRGIISLEGQCALKNINKNILKDNEIELLNFIHNQVNNSDDEITIYLTNNATEFNKTHFTNLCNKLLHSSTNHEYMIFDIILYIYQFQTEKRYCLSFDFSSEIELLSRYFEPIEQIASSYNNLKFEQTCSHNNLPIRGRIDVLDLDTNQIIELKFTNAITISHELQILMYYNNYYPKWDNNNPLEIINLKSGFKKSITIAKTMTNWQFNSYICKTLNTKMVDNIFLLDLETNTKENGFFPSIDQHEIIDRYVYEINLNSIASNGLIKNTFPVTNSHIHGIYDKDLIDADDISVFAADMKMIFKICDNPIFIAHNGIRFDFQVMDCNNLFSQYDDKRLIDSIPLLTHLTQSKAPSRKLIDIYNHIFKSKIQQLHRAKADVELMIDLFDYFKLTINEITGLTSVCC